MRGLGSAAVGRTLLTGVLVAITATACTGSLFHSSTPATTVYLLSAEQPAAAQGTPTLAADLAVLRPRVRAGLDTDRIAVLFPDHRLDYVADARWSGLLDAVLQDLTLQALHSGAHLRNVSADASAFTSGYWLEIEVSHFEADYGDAGAAPTIHVRLLARLGSAGDRRVLTVIESDITRTASANRQTAIVAAFQQAATAALGEVTAQVGRALAAGSAAPVAESR